MTKNNNKKSTKSETKKLNCESCKRSVTAVRFPGIDCSVCRNVFHLNCANLDTAKVDFIKENSVSWLCPSCDKPSRRSSLIVPPTSPTNLDDILQRLQNLEVKNENNEATITALNEKIVILESLLSTKSDKISKIEEFRDDYTERVNTLEQLKCDHTAEIQGLLESEASNPQELVDLIASQISCDNDKSSVENCFFAEKKERLVVTFKTIAAKESFVEAGKKFSRSHKLFTINGSSKKIHINDQLSVSRKRLFYDVKQFAHKNAFKFCWIHKSRILLKKLEQSKPIVIESYQNLSELEERINDANDLLSECSWSSVQNEGLVDGC